MRVFLTGASGFIGGHILRALAARGHQVTYLARGGSRQRTETLQLPGVTVCPGDFTQPETWQPALAGHDAVINSVGIIRETRIASFAALHRDAPIALFEAAQRAGVKKIVQISACGADEAAASQYHLTKRAADRRLAELGVPFVVLRPSLVYGPQDHSMTFFASLASLPVTLVPDDGQFLLQPIAIDDLVHAVVLAVERDDLANFVADAGGQHALSYNDLLDVLARQLGKPRVPKLRVPAGVMNVLAALTDRLGAGPISGEELSMLRRGNVADNTAFRIAFGFEPCAFETGLARQSFGQAERWQARLSVLRLPLRLAIAFIWLATGIVSAFISVAQGYDLLEQVSIRGPLATLALFGTAYFEIALGLATALGWRVRLMGAIQLVLMLGFTLILTAGLPDLWLHPFGPLTKNVPLFAATLVMMALED